jgi:hypothetical protein
VDGEGCPGVELVRKGRDGRVEVEVFALSACDEVYGEVEQGGDGLCERVTRLSVE